MKEQKAYMDKNFRFLVDAEGVRYSLDDPRVVHIWPYDFNSYTMLMIEAVYQKYKWKCRFGGKVSSREMQCGKRLSGGKGCLAFIGILGSTFRDIFEVRPSGEISLYYSLENMGFCKIPAWSMVEDVFAEGHKLKNVLFTGHPALLNNFFGKGLFFGADLLTAIIMGSLLEEAEGSLRCLTNEDERILSNFKASTKTMVGCFKKGRINFISAFKKWAKEMENIFSEANPEGKKKFPKVLILGGGALSIYYDNMREYYLRQGVIPKIVDLSEFVIHLEAELIVRHAFKSGTELSEQFNYMPLLLSFLNPLGNYKERYLALKSRFVITTFNLMGKYLREIADISGLTFDKFSTFNEIIREGNKVLPYNIHHENNPVLGRYLCAVEDGVFDGILHVSTTNCPSIQVQSLVHSLSMQNDIPFAAIEIDGPDLLDKQLRLMENVAIKAKHRFSEKEEK